MWKQKFNNVSLKFADPFDQYQSWYLITYFRRCWKTIYNPRCWTNLYQRGSAHRTAGFDAILIVITELTKFGPVILGWATVGSGRVISQVRYCGLYVKLFLPRLNQQLIQLGQHQLIYRCNFTTQSWSINNYIFIKSN